MDAAGPQPIDIEQFEKLVYQRRYTDAGNELPGILLRIKQGTGFKWYGRNPTVVALFTRLASAIASMISDPLAQINYDGFVRLIADHPTLHSIFKLSTYGSMDYVLGLVGQRAGDDPRKLSFDGNIMPKLLLCWALDSEVELDFEAMSKNAPEWVAAAMIGYLAIGGIHDEKAYNKKVELMGKAHLIEAAPLHEAMMIAVCDVYMHCSYMDIPGKHDIKARLNRLLRNLVTAKLSAGGQFVRERDKLERKARPKVLVPLEWFNHTHAMYRCYAPSVRQLRKRFEVVGMGRDIEVDQIAKETFDRFVNIPMPCSIDAILAMIVAEQPDIIWYPSIGMAAWWVALSNFGLAPIQIMSPGHPATSRSHCIEYIISDTDLFGDESNYTEKCVHMPVGGARYIGRELDKSKLKREHHTNPKIAVPAMVMKLIPPFLKTLTKVRHVLPGAEFHFFSNQQGAYHELITKELRAWIPDAVVHHRMDYQPYMELLAQCDVMLSSFPFGGTNSVIDAFLCEVPVVTWEGDEILSRSDASMIRRLKLPENFIAHGEQEYIQAARVVVAMSPGFIFKNAEDEFFGDEDNDEFLKAVWSIYERELDEQEGRILEGAGGNGTGIAAVDAGLKVGAMGQSVDRGDARTD